MPLKSLASDNNAVSIEVGFILNFGIIMIFSGAIVGAFYLHTDNASKEAMRAGATDLGSQISRDITDMYLMSANLFPSDRLVSDQVTFNIQRQIPLTFGGRGYRIKLVNATPNGTASLDIIDGSGYKVSTSLSAIDNSVFIETDENDIKNVVYSGSGEINITMVKNITGATFWLRIE